MKKTIYLKEYIELIDKLKNTRIKAGLTQSDVAKKLRKHQSYISKIENRERRLDVIELKVLADLYKKDINSFIENEQ